MGGRVDVTLECGSGLGHFSLTKTCIHGWKACRELPVELPREFPGELPGELPAELPEEFSGSLLRYFQSNHCLGSRAGVISKFERFIDSE